ncbi:O-antigen ligase family protein [Sphingomonas sp. AOB5]|uniref:O-antigen ligase family protein n=1 Tax=Sphingomonas sp. AOB5 TaxID=3034017 RepID=UPI0023FA1027|nr:O-antigen ligase family protein [Sphingomonas sp. AOB5]MDF7775445.1 O-antigen ligase family protein [Sphingomonas sp. AOB5]
MSSPLAELMGFNAGPVPNAKPIPRTLFWALLITVTAFYLSNTFNSALSQFLFSAKWLPLAALSLISLGMLTTRRVPPMPITTVLAMVVLLIVVATGAWRSVDRSFSVLSIATIAATVVTGYAISALLVATDSRRAFFDMLARFGRIMIALAAVMLVLRIDLGRGGGFAAWTDNPNTLAAMIAPPVVVLFAGCLERRPGWQVWNLAFLIVGLYLIWVTNARATIVWIALSFLAFAIYRQGPRASLIAVMLGAILLIGWWYPIKMFFVDLLGLERTLRDTGISPLSGREEVWRIGWNLFQERPLLGYGIGTSQDLLRQEQWRFVQHQGLHFHSTYIMMMVETGLFGLFALLAALFFSLWRGMADAARTRVLPPEQWPLAALPFAIVVGSMGHALFESWLLSAGNGNMLLLWTCVWMMHHQSALRIRAMVRRPVMPARTPAIVQPAE